MLIFHSALLVYQRVSRNLTVAAASWTFDTQIVQHLASEGISRRRNVEEAGRWSFQQWCALPRNQLAEWSGDWRGFQYGPWLLINGYFDLWVVTFEPTSPSLDYLQNASFRTDLLTMTIHDLFILPIDVWKYRIPGLCWKKTCPCRGPKLLRLWFRVLNRATKFTSYASSTFSGRSVGWQFLQRQSP